MAQISEIRFTRTLRSPSSERFIAETTGKIDVAVFDVHYLENGSVAVTLILLDSDYCKGDFIEELIALIDSQLLPTASMNDSDLVFTVVVGKYYGQYQNSDKSKLGNN